MAASPCLSRWGAELPGWVCALGGQRSVEEVRGFAAAIVGAVTAIFLLAAAGIVYEWRRSGLPFRDWWDSLR